jgi:hypothetical protein
MKRLVWFCGLLVLLAGFGGSGRSGGVSVIVTVHSWKVALGGKATRKVDRYTLTCDPPAGTLPFAARICADIRAHPLATVAPPVARTFCGGAVAPSPRVPGTFPYGIEVKAVVDGRKSVFGDDRPRECDWPVGWAAGLYRAAVANDARALAASEARLGCLEDPALLAQPTPWTLVYRCMGWPQSEAATNQTTLLLGRNPWLIRSMRRTVTDLFGGTHPIATRLISRDTRYDQRIVVLFEFADAVDCVTCGDDPAALADPTIAKVFRISYDRETRRGLVTKLCPTLSACR